VFGMGMQGLRAAQDAGTSNPTAAGVFMAGGVVFLLGLALLVWGLIARGGQKQAAVWVAVRDRFPFLEPTKQTVKTVMGRMSFDYALTPATASGLDHSPLEPMGTSNGYDTSIVLQGSQGGVQVRMGTKICGYGQSAISTVWIHVKVAGGLPYKLGVWTDRPDYDQGSVPVPPQCSGAVVRASDVPAAAALFHDGQLLQQLCAVAPSGRGAPTTLFWQHGEGFFECNLTNKAPVFERALTFALAFAARVAPAKS